MRGFSPRSEKIYDPLVSVEVPGDPGSGTVKVLYQVQHVPGVNAQMLADIGVDNRADPGLAESIEHSPFLLPNPYTLRFLEGRYGGAYTCAVMWRNGRVRSMPTGNCVLFAGRERREAALRKSTLPSARARLRTLIYDEREGVAATFVLRYLRQNPGSVVYLVYGAAHRFPAATWQSQLSPGQRLPLVLRYRWDSPLHSKALFDRASSRDEELRVIWRATGISAGGLGGSAVLSAAAALELVDKLEPAPVVYSSAQAYRDQIEAVPLDNPRNKPRVPDRVSPITELVRQIRELYP